MKHLCYSIIVLLSSSWTFSQSNTLTTGGDANGSGGSASYSVGQIDYVNNSGSNGSENQGVQQPYEFFTLSVSDVDDVSFSIFPNPTEDILIIQTSGNYSGMTYELTDMNGKLLQKETVSSSETILQMQSLPSSAYHLVLSKNRENITTYKIIKH